MIHPVTQEDDCCMRSSEGLIGSKCMSR